MDIITNLDKFPRTDSGCVLTIGNFDGVHLGHQEIINSAGNLAKRKNLPFYIMIFDPPPLFILRPDRRPSQISPVPLKLKLIEETNMATGIIMVKTEPKFLSLTPREFTWNILVEKLNVKYIVEGQTFNFGVRGSGTIVTLRELGQEFGFEAYMTPSSKIRCSVEGETSISSTLIRSQIATCHFDQARKCLGRNYILAGSIITGRGLGRGLGFPTANIKPYIDYQQLPEEGVFACRAKVGNNFEHTWSSETIYKAAVSLGHCRTFKDGTYQIEAHLLDYKGDHDSLVNKHITLEFVTKLRDQVKYNTTQELVRQIEIDCQSVREME